MTSWLNRGDGICFHLDEATDLCKIYENRPLVCRVDAGYELFSRVMTIEEYYSANLMACDVVRESQKVNLDKRIRTQGV